MPEVKPPPARVRLLAATEEMLRESGMSGIGIKDVVARSGSPIGSRYHYFPEGKTQLVTESLRIHAERVPRLLGHFFNGKRTAAAALRELFNTAAEQFEHGGANKACAIGAVTLDLMPPDAQIRDLCRKAFDDWAAVIVPHLPVSGVRSRRSFAVMIVAGLEGAFVLAKAAQSGKPFRDVGQWLSAMASPGRTDRRRRRHSKPKSKSRR